MHMRHKASIGVLTIGIVAIALASSSSHKEDTTALAADSSAMTFNSSPSGITPEYYQGSFFYSSTSEMLDSLAVRTYPEDKVFTFPAPELGLGSHIQVYRAQPVLIKDGNSEKLVRSWATNVQDLMDEQQIEVGDKDQVSPSLSEQLSRSESPLIITITRVAEAEVTTKESIEFSTKTVNNPEMEKGKQVVDTAGVNGSREKIYLVRRENGVETSRKLLSTTVTKEPVTQVTQVGTKIIQYGVGGASWYGGVPALTAAHKTLPKGTKVRVVNLENGKSVVVTIADRGPFVAGRIIDLSKDAFAEIASLGSGIAQVRIEKAY